MGRLVIAHHKSYHPYRRDNIERVRQDEEEARLKEEGQDARVMLADSEARIALLRKRNDGSRKKREHDYEGEAGPSRAVLEFAPADSAPVDEPIATTASGHLNLFADLEQQAMRSAITASRQAGKKSATTETERGVPLAPDAKDLKPWYSSRAGDEPEPRDSRRKETTEERRRKDTARKSAHDPLTEINTQLANHHRQVVAATSQTNMPPPRSRAIQSSRSTPNDAVRERLSRESSERERAAELIRRRRREMEGSMTPSTVHGGIDEGYSDRYNSRETEDAQRRRKDRRW